MPLLLDDFLQSNQNLQLIFTGDGWILGEIEYEQNSTVVPEHGHHSLPADGVDWAFTGGKHLSLSTDCFEI
jgi:hypothetical protein